MGKSRRSVRSTPSDGSDLFMPSTLEPVQTAAEAKKNIPVRRETAETMAARQKDISVSEFFAKTGICWASTIREKPSSPPSRKRLITRWTPAKRQAFCPTSPSSLKIFSLTGPRTPSNRADRVSVIDNGPGIVRKQVENVFGRLLFGSKFHRLKMSRGQQGIGISAAGMYGLITTGKPMVIHTRPSAKREAHHIELAMNTKTNRAEVTVDLETPDFPPARFKQVNAGTRDAGFLNSEDYTTGTSVSIELEGRYQKGRGSVDEFLELTAIANPHAKITFVPPKPRKRR